MLLEKLTQINAVSGNETDVQKFILQNIKDFADDISVDSMGNISALKKGKNPTGKKVMISSHMDEVGFIISGITDDGYLKFKSVGSIDPRILLSKKVLIGKDKIAGVIGIKAIHLQTKDERKNIIKEKDMYIDIGVASKDEALKYVSLGDYAVFYSEYKTLGDNLVKAKAIDDRVGCAILIELIKLSYDEDIYFCFTVQEEVGLRGARVLSYRISPDVCIVLESTTAADIPFMDEKDYATCLNGGPALSIMDRASYSNKKLNKFIENLAHKNNINFQFKRTSFGGNDAGAICVAKDGCQTAVLSVPTRYIHSPVCIASFSDINLTKELAKCVLENIDKYQSAKTEVLK